MGKQNTNQRAGSRSRSTSRSTSNSKCDKEDEQATSLRTKASKQTLQKQKKSQPVIDSAKSDPRTVQKMNESTSYELELENRKGSECAHLPTPFLKLKSKNILHLFRNLPLGIASSQNYQGISDLITESVTRFDVKHHYQSFSTRVTTIDWHPKLTNLASIGSKHGDIVFLTSRTDQDTTTFSEKGLRTGVGPGGSVTALKFHPEDPMKYYFASIDMCVRCESIDQTFSKVFFNTGTLEKWFCSLDAHKVKPLVVSGSNNGWCHMFSREGEKVWLKRLHKNKISHLEFSPRDDNIMCSASVDRKVCIWDLRKLDPLKPLATLQHVKGLNSAYFSLTDGSRLLTTDQHSELRVYSCTNWQLETTLKHPHRFFQHLTPIKAHWHPLKDLIFVGRYPDPAMSQYTPVRCVDIFDADGGKWLNAVRDKNYTGITSLCKFDYNGETLLTAMGHSTLFWKKEKDFDIEMDYQRKVTSDRIESTKDEELQDQKKSRKRKSDETIDKKISKKKLNAKDNKLKMKLLDK